MTELSTAIGLVPLWGTVLGISVGIVGLALVGLAYPLYNRILKREREKLAPEILRLTKNC